MRRPPVHGYSGRTLSQKLGVKMGTRLLHLNSPPSYHELLSDVWNEITKDSVSVQDADVIHVFCDDREALQRCVIDIAPHIQVGASLWVSWRKAKNGTKSNINREDVRSTLLSSVLVDVKVCAVDDVWSGLKFTRRRD